VFQIYIYKSEIRIAVTVSKDKVGLLLNIPDTQLDVHDSMRLQTQRLKTGFVSVISSA
jgi:hypothetical protein